MIMDDHHTLMDELEIATAKAEILHRLSNWGQYSELPESSYDPVSFTTRMDPDTKQLARLETRTSELARSRARASNRDFQAVLAQTQIQVLVELARIMAKSLDPVIAGTTDVTVGQEGEVCGVCQEEMDRGEEARAMDCSHKFHVPCIVKWLELKRTCPFCRHVMQVRKYEF